jgi:hypothetical protein
VAEKPLASTLESDVKLIQTSLVWLSKEKTLKRKNS